ncbi:Nicotinate-nucleotide-dimethylbenzimidazole phosphoribosyltransferase, prokaryotic [Syntrophomonas zehnderi OL-4]|uniref:Nicotinate-nucleotide--dimethylbenzimidazole phosphoribosyltransferase n=1 Tax=Syntrophomonas zehnderi OL-4 TaxID=690567 RepID=A0A0E3W3V2_9FIRM|nr:nicotinate-nucleotide--dimethylbenzimidazole phosphoribosyltransferase [Syntrophomonas zehnderi]CFY07219.1 Nicotinate-nucleotide-dimethylbenzimidazole phosphoribosyltransferase, prokaryotic [Syntrophomonas zehnderi OL-4]
MELLQRTLQRIGEVDYNACQEAQRRLDNLTKPPGSLGVLESIAVQLAGIQGHPRPELGEKVVMVMAADHGVAVEGISAFPQEVTRQMVINFLNHGAAVNVLAQQAGARVVVTDVGITGAALSHPDLHSRRVRPGTRNMAKEAAMTKAEAVAAVEIGIEMVSREIETGAALIATGEMGIGNTTASSAILACCSTAAIEEITGRGTGLNDQVLLKKQAIIKQSLAINQPDTDSPLDILSKVGGLEIAALTGVILGAAAYRTPVVLDGFISTAAALIACKLNEKTKPYLLASHLSQEPGHQIMLKEIGLKPMLHLDLRLGEGTGAVLAFPLIEAAVKIMHDMATFDQAGVSNGH